MGGTSTTDLIYALSKTPCFSGVYPSDRLPNKIVKYPSALIINFDRQHDRGSHWVAVFIDGFRHGYYFDSFGLQPFIPSIRKFLNSNCRKWSWGKRQLQSLESDVCGPYSALYLTHRSQRKSTKNFMKGFSRDHHLNDTKIGKRFRNHILRLRTRT